MNIRYYIIIGILLCQHIFTQTLPHFCVIIPTYRNAQYCLENIQTLADQTYTDWDAIIIIDGTAQEDDGTALSLEQFIIENYLDNKIKILQPNERRKALHNIYSAVMQIDDPETVIVMYDGDDYLYSKQALERIAQEYAQHDAWLTYGQYINVPENSIGHCTPFPQKIMSHNNFRNHPWIASHPRTCKTWLFKMIKLEDLLYHGNFYPVAWDVAFMPMLEMASKNHIRFIPDLLYAYRHHPANDYVHNYALLKKLEAYIRSKEKYRPLHHSRAQFFKDLDAAQADMIVFSKDRPLQLYAFLESLEKYATHIQSCNVIYHTSSDPYEQAYQEVKQRFPHVTFAAQSRSNPRADFKQLTLNTLNQLPSHYILFAVDDIIIKDNLQCNKAIRHLEETHAYALFLRLGKNTHYCYSCNFQQGIPHLLHVTPELCAWQFNRSQGDWAYPNNVDMTLYRKKDILSILEKLNFHTPNSCEAAWAGHAKPHMKKLGLCYVLSKIINIPANIVQHEFGNRHMSEYSPEYLLSIFNQGLKIDISQLHHINNNAAHTPLQFNFIRR